MATLFSVCIGLCYFSLAVSMFSLNALVFMALLTKKDYRKSTYRVIINVNVSCMAQLFVLACGGIMTMAQSNFNECLDKILGAILSAGWFVYIGMTLVLAVDRLSIFVRSISSCSSNATTILMLLFWLLGLSIFVLFLCPGYGYTYKSEDLYYFWVYNNGEGSRQVERIEPYFDLTIFVTVFFIYIFVVAHIIKDMPTLTTIVPGLCYFILSTILFAVNGVLLLTLLSSKEYKTCTYNVIKSLLVACMMQLFVFTVSGFMTIWQTVFHYILDRVLGLIMISGWMLYVGVTLTLAIDRLLIFICPRSRYHPIVTYTVLSSYWVMWLSLVVLMSMPGYGYTYEGKYYTWVYSADSGSRTVASIEQYYDSGSFAAVFVVYLVVLAYLLKYKLSSRTESSSFKTELKMFLVSAITFAYQTFIVVWSFWIPMDVIDPDLWDIILSIAWIIECGMFPVLTLILNKNLRGRINHSVRKQVSINAHFALATTQDMPTLTTIVPGLCYFILSIIFFAVNGVLLLTLLSSKEYKTCTYNVIKSLLVACMMQLFVFTVSGFMTIWQTVFHHILDRVLGVIMISGWVLYVGVTLTLAIDRLLIFIYPRSHYNPIITYTALSSYWVIWLSLAVLMSLPGYEYTYEGKYYTWIYSEDSGSQVVASIEQYYDIGSFAAVFVVYLAVFVYLLKFKLSSRTESNSFKAELKMFLVSAITFAYQTFIVVWSFWIPMDFIDPDLWDIILSIAWIIECGMFPVLTLILNKNLRGRVQALVSGKRNQTPVAIFQTSVPLTSCVKTANSPHSIIHVVFITKSISAPSVISAHKFVKSLVHDGYDGHEEYPNFHLEGSRLR
ncbi:hypothetical protein QR680_003700 [Steinernema hermaphroditum]|uniref:Uncharacterized protein n=1 Tax=Steinernema hermaphroditum TaxID=289476 RepID=A0AA39LSE7_9BILA|nr:hypothetical protein QR680_003700 [Steinernema hermaphroditum]